MEDRDISKGQLYAALARLRLRGRACDAAVEVIEGVCATYAEAAQRHGISRAAVSQAAKRIRAVIIHSIHFRVGQKLNDNEGISLITLRIKVATCSTSILLFPGHVNEKRVMVTLKSAPSAAKLAP